MAMYKVPQDVEGEDKFLGPLTFKQFLFGGGAVIMAYIIFLTLSKGLGFLSIVFFPFFIIFAVLAFPWGKDQPTEIWLASRFRYLFFPRKRIWDQSGIKNLVTITAPIREKHIYSDGLKKDQVESRLSALASVVDSRGWATKNIAAPVDDASDRLVAGNRETSNKTDEAIVNDSVDVLDKGNAIASQFDTMIKKSADKHRQATLDMVKDALKDEVSSPQTQQPASVQQVATPSQSSPEPKKKLTGTNRQATLDMLDSALDGKKAKSTGQPENNKAKKGKGEDYWFLNQQAQPQDPNYTAIRDSTVVQPGQASSTKSDKDTGITASDEATFLDSVHKKQDIDSQASELGRIKTIKPLSEQVDTPTLPTVQEGPIVNSEQDNASATPVNPGILTLPYNNDLNVETVGRIANKKDEDDGEVVINLH